MEKPLFRKPEPPNFENPVAQKAFVDEVKDQKELFQKELDVALAEQMLLTQRMGMMKEFINDLPASDPQYTMLLGQIQMDQIEYDELKIRKASLEERISEL